MRVKAVAAAFLHRSGRAPAPGVRPSGRITPFLTGGRCSKSPKSPPSKSMRTQPSGAAMITAIRILRAVWALALLLAVAPASEVHGAESKAEAKVVAFGLFGDQSVFESEAKGAAQIVASQFRGGAAVVRARSERP